MINYQLLIVRIYPIEGRIVRLIKSKSYSNTLGSYELVARA